MIPANDGAKIAYRPPLIVTVRLELTISLSRQC
jgi:hypothetical protein